MKFLITGGAGFIGGTLANTLVRQGHVVRVLDDVSAGDPSRLDANVALTRGDVNDVPKLWSLLQGVDCVYHLAARVSVSESVLYPRDYNATNVGGTVALIQAVRDAGVRRLVLASSGAIYGEQGEARRVFENRRRAELQSRRRLDHRSQGCRGQARVHEQSLAHS